MITVGTHGLEIGRNFSLPQGCPAVARPTQNNASVVSQGNSREHSNPTDKVITLGGGLYEIILYPRSLGL